ncbi:unnamed protein product [Sphagnum jensenii]
MSNTITTSNMGLTLPIPGVDPGPDYALNNNVSFQKIDTHNHSAGNGVQITPSGLNINSDLTFLGNSATNLKLTSFTAQSLVSTLGSVYVKGNELFYNDFSGNSTQLTLNGNVNATSSGISSGTATASFVAGVLVVNANTNTPANIQGASLLLGNNVSGSNYLTLAPPASLASSYTITLPTIPAQTSFVTIDTSGTESSGIAPDNSSLQFSGSVLKVKAGGITQAMLAAGAASLQVQTFTSSGSWTAPAGVSQVIVYACGGGGGGANGAGGAGAGGGGGAGVIAICRTSTVVPGTAYPVTVGSGGSAGTAGGSSTFNDVTAPGGAGGSGVNGGAGSLVSSAAGSGGSSTGAGGAGAAGLGFTGGSGGSNGTGNTSGGGGGGGGDGGTGGQGGSGTSHSPTNGQPGNGYGAGGGGGSTLGTGGAGFGGYLPSLPDTSSTYLTTFNGGLTAIGTELNVYSTSYQSWVNKGTITPLDLNVNPLVRNNLNQYYADSAIATNGLICTVYTETNNGALTYKYTIQDSTTFQTVVNPTLIAGTGTTTHSPRVFFLDPYFIILFDDLVSATNFLKYIAIPSYNPTAPKPVGQISSLYAAGSAGTVDGVVFSNNLYIFWNGSSTTIKGAYLTTQLTVSAAASFGSHSATTISVCVDASASAIYCSWIEPSTANIYTLAVGPQLGAILSPTELVSSSGSVNIATAAQNGVLGAYYEVTNSYPSSVPSNYISSVTCSQSGSVGTPAVTVRSVGLASKAFIYNGVEYFCGIYCSTYQSTYFLFNSYGQVIAKLSYENAPNYYYTVGLPSVTVTSNLIQFPYLYKDLIESLAVNNSTGASQAGNIYSQTGVNLCSIAFGTESLNTAEIGSNLNISGGFVGAYDGTQYTEQNFFLFPENIAISTATTGGSLAAQEYFYQVTYEWTDNQGNAFRSAPSIPVSITTTGSTSTNTLVIPTLRLTYKITNPVKIVIYRWSAAQQSYYQITSITAPLLNNPAADTVTYTDTAADSSILGNNLIYTTGGVVEDVSPPATSIFTLFNDRLWLVDAEDRNLLWYSKQVIESTPVEMSDLFTLYVAPTTGAQGSTGPITALSAMDDKLIVFKENAIYYINGAGPDNTGANDQYSEPIFITSTVGCAVPKSIVFSPNGLMFQSDKGIWLLGRDLSTQYIGAAVEEFNSTAVLSAINIPTENQVRFTLDSGTTLMYDYFYNQWGTFTGIPGLSSTIFQGLHTFINSYGQSFQESIGNYLDGSNPVLMSFITSWFNLSGLQGYERAYYFYVIGQYYSPHKLQVEIAYDYAASPTQLSLISPTNYSPAYGSDSTYGLTTPYGGQPQLEQWKIDLQRQTCQAFQIQVSEIYDSFFQVAPGDGLTLSGINLVYMGKKGYVPKAGGSTVG